MKTLSVFKKITSPTFFVLYLLISCIPAAAQGYSPRVLFSLEIGKEDNQIGINTEEPSQGPNDIAVGANGSVYIADTINKCVKHFDESGNLKWLIKSDSDTGLISDIGIISVDGRGNLYTISSNSTNELSKYGPDGELLWQTDLSSMLSSDLRSKYYAGFGQMSYSSDGKMCVRLLGKSNALMVLDDNGSLLGIREGYGCNASGRIFSVSGVPDDKLGVQHDFFDFAGNFLERISTSPIPIQQSLFQDVEGLAWETFDSADHLYTVTVAASRPPIQVSADLTITSDTIVTRYNPTGRPIAQIRFPALPFLVGNNVAIDPLGNIYHLSYDGEHIQVVKYKLDINSEKLETIRESPMVTVNNTNYVPLRFVANYLHMRIDWDAKSKTAELSSEQSPDRGTMSLKFGINDKETKMHYGRIWISQAACNRLQVSMSTDSNHKLAYLKAPSEKYITTVQIK